MQTLKQLSLLAEHMGITAHELHRRRASRTSMCAYADSEAQVHIRPRIYVSPDLPDTWKSVYRTIVRIS